MLPIRSIVLALCATVAIAAPLSGNVCPTDGDCPTCFGRQTPDLHDIVCNSESAFIVVTGVDTDGKKWSSPRRWQDIFGAHGSRYAIEHFPFDERHWDEQADSTCRTYYAKPAYEITQGQLPRRVQTPDVAAFKLNSRCSCIGLIHEAGYAVVAFRNRTVAGSDELASQPLNKDVIVVPLPRGEFKIPSCNAKFTEDKSAISTEKLPAVFANDETQLECDKVTSCPKCEYLQRPEQLKDICQSSKELMIVKQSLSREDLDSPNAPWHMPKIEVYVDKDSTQQDSYEIRTKITSRGEKGCVKPTLRLLTGLTDNLDNVVMLKDMQLGEECQCDFIRHDHGFAMIRSERELHKSDVLSDKETIIMLPRGQYVLPQCPSEDENQRSDNDDDEKAQCEQPEETCPVCEESVSEQELYKGIQSGEAFVVKMKTNSQLKKSVDSDEVRCGTSEVLSVIKGEQENVKSELSFTLPERCRCGAMSGYGRQFYAVVKKDAVEGDRLDKLPLNEKVFIIGHDYRSNNLIKRWLNPEAVDEAEDRSSYDGYASYAPSYGYSAPSYPAPSYGYSAPSYSAPSYGYSAPSYGYSAPSYSAPSYGYSAPSYSAPSYGYSAPSYSAPSYGYSAPSYSAPSYGYSAPSYSAPSYGYSAPSYSAPSYSAPSYGYSAPSYSAPSYGYSAPSYSAPSYGYSAPSYSAPSYGYSAPSYSAPSYGYSAPVSYAPMYSSSYSYMQPSYGMDYSAPSYGYSAPSYSAPSYGYSAPSYSAPSYGYSAPSYSAPSYGYSAPSYSAPSYGYSAPSYSAPSYDSGYSSYSAPSYGYSAPSYSAPSYGYSAPSYSAPSYGYSAPSYGYSAPSYSAPSYGYSAPSYSAPSYGYSAPSYSAPSYGYSAPSYSAPSYGYSAPSYSAPSYSAPSYSAPSYGYSAPSYSAPSYSAPSYGYSAPSYDSYSAPSYSAPSYSAPSYSAPSYSAPSYSAPSYSAPSYSAPSYDSYSAPSYSAPSYSAPSYSAPSYSAPSYSAPSYSAPSYSAPSYSAPSYSAPSYSAPSYSAPSYSAPSYGYSAPSYSAPSYGYSAPSYSAPSYSAPSYSAPSYSAPSYSAPSYGYSAPSYSAPSYSAPSYSAPSYSAPSYGYSAPSYGGSYDTPQIAVSYSMPVTIPIVTAKSTYSKGYGYGKGGYGNDYGKTSGTQIVETKVEATYTTVVGIQSADSYPSTGPTYQPGYQQAPGYSYQQ